MPPHRPHLLSAYVTSHYLQRIAKCLILGTTIALAGCATNANRQQSQSDSSYTSALDNYLSQTQSDPIGAYFATTPYSGINRYDSSYNISRYDSSTSSSPGNGRSDRPLAQTALNFLGIKYRYGGDTPTTGFDCSGLVTYAAEKSLGLKLPRRSAELAHEGLRVERDDLERGDLVFFNTRGSRNSHVGIYLGNDKFIHAPRTGSVVRIASMDDTYWKKRYNGARRLAANATDMPIAPDAAETTRARGAAHSSKTAHARRAAKSKTSHVRTRTRTTAHASKAAPSHAKTTRTRTASRPSRTTRSHGATHVASAHHTAPKKVTKR